MRAAARRPGWTWTQQDTLGFVFDEVLRDMDIDQSYDGSLNYDAARLILGTNGDGMGLDELQRRIWKRRFREGCSPEALDAIVDELLDKSFEYLDIKVVAAAEKTSKVRLRRAA